MKPSCKITVPEVMDLFTTYKNKEGNGAWGNLHIVLADRNVHDYHVEFCKNECIKKNDTDGLVLANLLLQMSKSQRYKLSRLA